MNRIAVAVISAAMVVGLSAGTASAITPPLTCKKGYHRQWIPTGNGTIFRYVCVPNHKHSK